MSSSGGRLGEILPFGLPVAVGSLHGLGPGRRLRAGRFRVLRVLPASCGAGPRCAAPALWGTWEPVSWPSTVTWDILPGHGLFGLVGYQFEFRLEYRRFKPFPMNTRSAYSCVRNRMVVVVPTARPRGCSLERLAGRGADRGRRRPRSGVVSGAVPAFGGGVGLFTLDGGPTVASGAGLVG